MNKIKVVDFGENETGSACILEIDGKKYTLDVGDVIEDGRITRDTE